MQLGPIMKQYLLNYITDSQVKYPSIFSQPVDVVKHLLYVNGNGCEFLNGNPCVLDETNTKVLYEQYYARPVIFETALVDRINSDDFNKHVSYLTSICVTRNNFFKRMAETKPEYVSRILTEEQLAEEAKTSALRDLANIESIRYEDVTDMNYWLRQICKSEYFPTLHLSEKYIPLVHLNANTERSLLDLAILVTQAYITFYDTMSDDILPLYKHLEFRKNCVDDAEALYKHAANDKAILQHQLNRLVLL